MSILDMIREPIGLRFIINAGLMMELVLLKLHTDMRMVNPN